MQRRLLEGIRTFYKSVSACEWREGEEESGGAHDAAEAVHGMDVLKRYESQSRDLGARMSTPEFFVGDIFV